jgi:hypothetical protein
VAFVKKTLDSLPAFAGTKGRGNDEFEQRGADARSVIKMSGNDEYVQSLLRKMIDE